MINVAFVCTYTIVSRRYSFVAYHVVVVFGARSLVTGTSAPWAAVAERRSPAVNCAILGFSFILYFWFFGFADIGGDTATMSP
jgi:hypothetical protein